MLDTNRSPLPDMTDAYQAIVEKKKKEDDEKPKRWQDDDGDGKWYEKSDVDGKISDLSLIHISEPTRPERIGVCRVGV